jgi:hypothetical protein
MINLGNEGETAVLCAAAAMSVACGRQSMSPTAQEQGIDRGAKACQQAVWSTPAPLLTPSASKQVVARSPSIVADGRNVYVFGNDVLANGQPVRVGETLTAWRVGYGSIGAPASDSAFVFITPKATLDAAGRLHVLWAEPPSHGPIIPPFQFALQPTTSLWTAAYDPEHGWSSPTLVYSGVVSWNWPEITGPIAPGPNGESVIAVPSDNGGLIVLALRDDRWTVTAIPRHTPGAYAASLDLGDRRLLAVVASDTTQHQDRNSLFLYSQDADDPWQLVRQVQRSGSKPAMEVRLLKEPGGRVHMVWRQMLREDYSVIRHAYSDDRGDSWTQPTDLEPGGVIQNVDAAIDGCGRLHVVYEDWNTFSSGAVRIGYARWDHGWSRPQLLHPEYIASNLTLFRKPDGSLTLAFLGTSGKAEDTSGWAMMYSDLR